jgi:nitrite reductase (NADH) small subunit
MALHDAGALQEFSDQALRIVRVGGQEVGIVRRGDQVRAIRNACPHQAAPLCAGTIRSHLAGAGPGLVSEPTGSVVIACPWHGWEFDIETGRSTWDPRYRVRTYPTSVRDGRVWVEIGSAR